MWGNDYYPSSNVVEVCFRYHRNKIGANRNPTIRSAGYRLAGRRPVRQGHRTGTASSELNV